MDSLFKAQTTESEGMARTFEIDGTTISDTSPCYVIAEIGANHQGRLDLAKDLIRAAKDSGADAAKFQKRDNQSLYTKAMYDSPYGGVNSFGESYGAHRNALELDTSAYAELLVFARSLEITFLASAWDFPSVDLLHKLQIPAFKACSGDLTNIPLLEHMAATGRPIILSTGGGELDDVDRAQAAICAINPELAILQCTSAYPTSLEDLHLGVIPTLRGQYPDLVVGLSDHYPGTDMAAVAYALGARIIEKHFTLDRSWPGTDQAFSLLPAELRHMVDTLGKARKAIGDGCKSLLPQEKAPILKLRKKLVAARDLPSGHILTANDLAIKSPGGGLAPHQIHLVIGQRTLRRLAKDQTLELCLLSDP
jgi:N-acetylneuraminate synthase/sialic acid synthase